MVVSWLPVFISPIKLTVTFTAAQFSCSPIYSTSVIIHRETEKVWIDTDLHISYTDFCCLFLGGQAVIPP